MRAPSTPHTMMCASCVAMEEVSCCPHFIFRSFSLQLTIFDLQPELLCCDFCEKAYHLNCHVPPVSEVPAGHWMCQECERTLEETDDSATVAPEEDTKRPQTPRRSAKRSKRNEKNPFNLFYREFCAQQKASGKQGSFAEQGSGPGSWVKAAAAEWGNLSAEEKGGYVRRAKKLHKIDDYLEEKGDTVDGGDGNV